MRDNMGKKLGQIYSAMINKSIINNKKWPPRIW